MFFPILKVLRSHGRQFIPRLDEAKLPDTFRGRPTIAAEPSDETAEELCRMCPSGAVSKAPFTIDLGRCVFCNECAMRYPDLIRFTSDFRLATNDPQRLRITAQSGDRIALDPERVRREIRRTFGRALRLRQVCAGGDGSTEMELNATMNVNFDFGRYGIEFVASPRHADGIVVSGPVTANMAVALELCYRAVATPRIVILAGSEAVSGGLFAGSEALDRSFLDRVGVDLYIPGNPVHPLTFIDGVMSLTGRLKK